MLRFYVLDFFFWILHIEIIQGRVAHSLHKSGTHLTNSSPQKGDLQQGPYWGSTNISGYCTNSCCHVVMAPGICALCSYNFAGRVFYGSFTQAVVRCVVKGAGSNPVWPCVRIVTSLPKLSLQHEVKNSWAKNSENWFIGSIREKRHEKNVAGCRFVIYAASVIVTILIRVKAAWWLSNLRDAACYISGKHKSVIVLVVNLSNLRDAACYI